MVADFIINGNKYPNRKFASGKQDKHNQPLAVASIKLLEATSLWVEPSKTKRLKSAKDEVQPILDRSRYRKGKVK